MCDENDFSYKISDLEKIEKFKKTILEIPVNNTFTLSDDSNEKKTLQMVNDQLIAVRLKKHNDFMTLKDKRDSLNNDNKNTNSKSNDTDTNNIKSRKSVILCGDSMLNGIDSNGVSSKKHQVTVRNFPGATSKDMIDYIKPLTQKKPDVMIIHIGTNDLTKNIENKRSNLKKIVENIKENSPSTDISLSNICLREDDLTLDKKRKALNDQMESLATDYGLKVIDNANIDSNCLSRRKLHLNHRIGIPKFVKNVKNHMVNDC